MPPLTWTLWLCFFNVKRRFAKAFAFCATVEKPVDDILSTEFFHKIMGNLNANMI